MTVQPLPIENLRRACSQSHFPFETTAEIAPQGSIIGQPRGTQAIEFGIGVQSQGYNIYVLGETGTGRTTAIHRFLREKTAGQPAPPDWVYVNDFQVPHQPRAISFPPGGGLAFQRKVANVLECLRDDLPKAFDTELYREALDQVRFRLEEHQNELLQGVQEKARAKGFTLLRTPKGLDIAPFADGKVMTADRLQALSAAERQEMEKNRQELTGILEDAFYEIRQHETRTRDEVKQLNRQVADNAIKHHFTYLIEEYQASEEVCDYVEGMHLDVLNHLGDFQPSEEKEGEADLRRYQVNILVDNSQTEGPPVVVETNPTYANLIGRIEYEAQFGVMSTHFTNIKAGSLHRANGGYLVINVRDLLQHPLSWEALKRAISERQIRMQSPDSLAGMPQVLAKSLDPEPIPLSVKVILMGSPSLYYLLYERDEEFGELFKVKADFDSTMPRDHEHEDEYAAFIAGRCHEEGLNHFDRSAVAAVVEYGSRLCSHQDKLSTRFGIVADLVREASYWSSRRDASVVTSDDVYKAIREHAYRANRTEQYIQEQFDENTLMITVDGGVVGQVNGLSVLDLGDYTFGQPSRITAQTYMGEAGVINIEREVDMAGPLHNKGLLTLIGYLGDSYAQNQPLSLSASLAFEQNYGGIDGDSASSTELYALISSLSGLPIDQGRAVTGSVNQKGEVQPIGGATEKIEGFFDVCNRRGLTGNQGVLIPAGNVKHLMLKPELLDAIEAGRFHVWAVRTIDEGVELLMGKPAGKRQADGSYPEGTVHAAVQQRLRQLAMELKKFGNSDED